MHAEYLGLRPPRHVLALALLSAVGLASGCKKTGPADPGNFEDFLVGITPGSVKSPASCAEANDGKRWWLDGYFHIPSDITLDHGKTRLGLYRENDPAGNGRGDFVVIRVSLGNWLTKGDIDDLWESAKHVKTAPYGTQSGEISEDALRIHLADGSSAGPKDKVRLTVKEEVLPRIDPSGALSCEYVFESAARAQ